MSSLENKLKLYSSTHKTIDRIFAEFGEVVNKFINASPDTNKSYKKDVKSKNEHHISGGYHPPYQSDKKDWCKCDKGYDRKPQFPNYETTDPRKEELKRLRSDAQDVTSKLINILIKKHSDYGPNNIAKAPGGPLNGLSVRLHDKVERLSNLIEKNAKPSNESIEDTFIDIANYAIIALLVLDNKWK